MSRTIGQRSVAWRLVRPRCIKGIRPHDSAQRRQRRPPRAGPARRTPTAARRQTRVRPRAQWHPCRARRCGASSPPTTPRWAQRSGCGRAWGSHARSSRRRRSRAGAVQGPGRACTPSRAAGEAGTEAPARTTPCADAARARCCDCVVRLDVRPRPSTATAAETPRGHCRPAAACRQPHLPAQVP